MLKFRLKTYVYIILSNLNDGSKILAIDGIFSLQVDITQFTGPYWVIFGIEFIKALEGLAALQHKGIVKYTKP